jgi:hypothetical protein
VKERSVKIEYRGPAGLADALVKGLEDEGVQVSWRRPMERRDIGELARTFAIAMVANGSTLAIQAGIAKFRKQFGSDAEITSEEDAA